MSTVIFLTAGYPYGDGETFIENEIDILADKFNRVIVIATEVAPEVNVVRKLPDNAISLRINRKEGNIAKLSSSFVMGRLYLSGKAYKEDWKNRKKFSERKFILRVEERSWYIWEEIRKSGVLDDIETDEIIVYSYWLLITARVGTLIQEQSGLQIKHMISRAHRFDLYEETSHVGFLPYRKLFFEKYDIIASCSKNGTEYLDNLRTEKNVDGAKAKVVTAYLGTRDYGVRNTDETEVLRIVSCSHLVPQKRVERIAIALRKISDTYKIHWIHIGSGSLLPTLVKTIDSLLETKHIEVNLQGALSNSEVIAFYQENPIDVFVNVSSSEGLPVSIMEAMSFGIPVIATNVGGVSEIIENNVNGFLLECEYEDKDLIEKIEEFLRMKRDGKSASFRKAARATWEKHFLAEKQYHTFWENLLKRGTCARELK